MGQNIRVRYPPSPTGDPHVGNVRTAIFNWLFARHYQGSFIIRIEDTDQARKIEGAAEGQLEALRWLGVDWDEGPDIGGAYGPYVQSERLPMYSTVSHTLMGKNMAYDCYCSNERISLIREEQTKLKIRGGYDRRCRNLTDEQREEKKTEGILPVLRFKMPLEGNTSVTDLIRGHVSFRNDLVDDFVIIKSDGFPTYHLANVVDDHFMEISHVMRAEEWLSSLPRHVQLYSALGWDMPEFAHLPIILAADSSKLSKRHGATSVHTYRSRGYLPDAMVNFLALLGWSLDDKTERISRSNLIKNFSINRVGKSGAIFNSDKLDWMNGTYIREMDIEDLADNLLGYWREYSSDLIPDTPDREYLLRIVPLIQKRIKTLADAADLISFFFKDKLEYEPEQLLQKGMDADNTREILKASRNSLSNLESFESESIENNLRSLSDELGIKTRQIFGSLRVATSGQQIAPPLFQTMEILGKDRVLLWINNAINSI